MDGKTIEIFKSFSKLPEAIEKYGIQNIVMTMILSCVLGLMLYVFANPEVIVKKINEVENKIQTEEYQKRMEIDPQVRAYMLSLKSNLYADRVCVFETHNGGSNLNGLKFIYMDMTYDEFQDGMESVSKEYTNLRTSTNQWIGFVCDKGIWYGEIEDVKNIDLSFYYRLKNAGIKKIGAFVMEGQDRPTGCVVVCYYDEEHKGCQHSVSNDFMLKEMAKYGSKIGYLLNNIE